MQPQFIDLPEKKMVGMGANFISILSPAKNNAQVIPALWDRFIQQIDSIQHRTSMDSFGLVEDLPGKPPHSDELLYIACVEVFKFDSVPEGMLTRTIPACHYASFTHKGKLDSLEKTMKYIYTTWLPTSGRKLRPAPHLELYDDRFNPHSDQSEFDILLPIH